MNVSFEQAQTFSKEMKALLALYEELGGADGIAEQLDLLTEVYVQNARIAGIDLANTVSLTNRLKRFFFNLNADEIAAKLGALSQGVLTNGEQTKICIAN